MYLAFFAVCILLIFSPYYHSPKDAIILFIEELISKNFALLYGFICVSKKEDLKPSLKVIIPCLLLLTFFGILNFVYNESVWLQMVQEDVEEDLLIADYSSRTRFRVQSMFSNPFVYGYTCIICLLIYIYAYNKKLVSKIAFLMVALNSLFGMIICGCRTVWGVALIGLIIYYVVQASKKGVVRFVIISALVLVPISLLVFDNLSTESKELFTQAFNTDTNMKANVGGSSIGMRIVQLGAVLYYIQDNYLFGRGKGFFLVDMGWGEGKGDTLVDQDLFGLEGVYLNFLLERGFVGLSLWALFYFLLALFYYQHRKENRHESSFGLSIISVYFVFAMSTGELNVVYLTLLITGAIIAIINSEMLLNGRNAKLQ